MFSRTLEVLFLLRFCLYNKAHGRKISLAKEANTNQAQFCISNKMNIIRLLNFKESVTLNTVGVNNTNEEKFSSINFKTSKFSLNESCYSVNETKSSNQ